VTVVHNSAGGYDTYMLVHSQYLPLLGLRQAASAVFLTPFTEPVLSAFEPLLRILVDMSYTDRLNLDPATPTPFSLITPPGKILEALGAVPGALAQGLANLLSGGQLAIAPANQNVNALSAASIPAADSGGTAAVRLAAVPEPEAEPKLKVEPEATIAGAPPKASSGSTTETAAPTASSTGSGTTTPTTGTTTTTTTTTGTTTTTTGTTAGEASDDTASEDDAAA
jgi:hypothetical protein